MHLRKALQGLAASGHPFRVSLSATPQAGSPSAAANASRSSGAVHPSPPRSWSVHFCLGNISAIKHLVVRTFQLPITAAITMGRARVKLSLPGCVHIPSAQNTTSLNHYPTSSTQPVGARRVRSAPPPNTTFAQSSRSRATLGTLSQPPGDRASAVPSGCRKCNPFDVLRIKTN